MVTVSICTYRRFDRLPFCLESLKNQTVSQDQYKILIIDNSLEPEQSAVFKDSLKGFKNLQYIITEKCGIAYARNEAIKHCQTDILAYTDDDCIVPSNWVETFNALFNQYPESIAAIGGRVKPLWESAPPKWLQGDLLCPLALIDWGEHDIIIDHQDKWLLTANAAYRTEPLRRAGGFPEHLGRKRRLPLAQEEFAANQSLRTLGYELLYTPLLEVSHFIPSARIKQEAFCRDAFWEGVSQALYRRAGINSNETDILSEALFPIITS
jgi:GT2 family glycosyltransferase